MERTPALEYLRMLLALGEETEAAHFVLRLRRDSADADALLAPVAATLLEREHHELALELADEALHCDRRCGRAHQVRIDALAELGDLDAARRAAEDWVASDPGSPEAHIALSWARLADYDDLGAAEAAARARDLDPDGAGGWLAMAYVSRLGRRWDQLAAYSLQALDRDPDNGDARLFFGEALLAQGRVDEGTLVLRGLDDPRARAALRHLRLRRTAVSVLTVALVVVIVIGLAQGSVAVLVGGAVGLALADRRQAARLIGHPVVLWGALALAAAALVHVLV